jgi:hypothetical protein
MQSERVVIAIVSTVVATVVAATVATTIVVAAVVAAAIGAFGSLLLGHLIPNVKVVIISSGGYRMDLPGPTTSVGSRTDYSVGPWDYPTCAARYLMVWSTRTTEEKYSVRKLYMSRTV